MRLEIWSDVVCPWCFVGKRNLEEALAGFDHRDEVDVVWRSFELDPTGPAVREGDYVGRLARKYGVDRDQAQAMVDRIVAAGAAAGIPFRFDVARPGNTFDAHRVLHLARARGVQNAVKERFLTATFCDGEPIGDRATLVRLAADAGLDGAEVAEVLEAGTYAEEVRADERRAADLGVSGVPFFVVDGAYGLGGAQRPELLRKVLERRWAERAATAAEAGHHTA